MILIEKKHLTLILASIIFVACKESPKVFEEIDGMVSVEAEHFFEQSADDVRRWYIVREGEELDIEPDPDPNHAASASGKAYIELLPDTRVTHDDALIVNENFSNEPGKMAVVSYQVYFNTPGKYYVWARAYSTGTEDNGIHVGINDAWPESGMRMQWIEKDTWAWETGNYL